MRSGKGLPECEDVGLGAPLEKADFQRSVADRLVLAYQLVQAALPKHTVAVLVHVDAA
jgi:hypothetical protein